MMSGIIGATQPETRSADMAMISCAERKIGVPFRGRA